MASSRAGGSCGGVWRGLAGDRPTPALRTQWHPCLVMRCGHGALYIGALGARMAAGPAELLEAGVVCVVLMPGLSRAWAVHTVHTANVPLLTKQLGLLHNSFLVPGSDRLPSGG
eukprot:364636-Chlamydomonas_euryale.AAC.4